MYIHEILEWLSEARSQERLTSSIAISKSGRVTQDEQINETECAILNGVSVTQTRPNTSVTTT